ISSAGGRQVAIRASGLGDQFTNPAEEWQGELSRAATQTGSCSVAGQTGAERTTTTAADGTDTVRGTNDAITLRAPDHGAAVRAGEWQGEVSRQATQTGSCSVAGQTGAEWTRTTDADGTDTVCVTNDGIILRATDDGRVVWETTRVQRGAQNAALFTVPEGVEVMDLGNLGALRNQAERPGKDAN